MRDNNILKCKSESTNSSTTNGGSNISYGQYLIKYYIISKSKHETVDEEFINDEAAGIFI